MSKESRKALADQSRIQAVFGEPGPQNRWSVLFRLILMIPLGVVSFVRAIAVEFLVFIGWFYALVMGRMPARPASYIARNVLFQTRVQAYGSLMLDEYPPFSLDDQEYPVQVSLHPGPVGRLSVLFRLILLIPAAIVESAVAGGFFVALFFIWLIVLIKGRMPRSLFEAVAAMLRYGARYEGYLCMVSSAYPGELFGDAVLVSTPWPPAGDAGLAYPPPSASSGVASPPAAPWPTPADAFPTGAAEAPTTPYPGGPRYAFSEQDEPRPNAPFSVAASSPPPSPWGFDQPSPPPEPQRRPFVLSKEAKRILVLFIVLGVLFNGFTRVFPLAILTHANDSTPQAEQAAEAIGYQAADFPPGTPANYSGAGSVEFRSAPGQCSPVSSQPWLADVFSGNFSLASNSVGAYAESTYSNVVIMPNASYATNSLDAISAAGYAASCFKPYDDKAIPSSYTGSAACGSLSLQSSTIQALQTPNLGVPVVAYRYTATMRCSLSGATFPIYDDTIGAVIGPVFISADFSETNNAPTPAQEQHYMSVMTTRAPADLSGTNVVVLGGAHARLPHA